VVSEPSPSAEAAPQSDGGAGTEGANTDNDGNGEGSLSGVLVQDSSSGSTGVSGGAAGRQLGLPPMQLGIAVVGGTVVIVATLAAALYIVHRRRVTTTPTPTPTPTAVQGVTVDGRKRSRRARDDTASTAATATASSGKEGNWLMDSGVSISHPALPAAAAPAAATAAAAGEGITAAPATKTKSARRISRKPRKALKKSRGAAKST
jgi:hypothetical protein